MTTHASHLHAANADAQPAARTGSAAVISLAELPDHPRSADAVIKPEGNPLHAVKVRLNVRVGTIDTTMGELLAARAGDVLPLDRSLHQPVDLVIDDRVVARGQLVALDGCFAVKISELPTPLTP